MYLAAITRCGKDLGFGQTTVMITNICACLCAVQGLLLLSSEVIKRGFEQGSHEQVGMPSCHHAARIMQHTSVRPIHRRRRIRARRCATRTHAQRWAATHADRRRVHSCRCALEAPGVAEVGGVHDAWASRPAVVGHAVAPVSPLAAARAMPCGMALMPHARKAWYPGVPWSSP